MRTNALGSTLEGVPTSKLARSYTSLLNQLSQHTLPKTIFRRSFVSKVKKMLKQQVVLASKSSFLPVAGNLALIFWPPRAAPIMSVFLKRKALDA